jgi:EAL domain-containing protein (putative c-di-GMP-specific phosphodiesterase class I)
LKSALDQHMAWRDQLGKKFQISVNISPRHIQMSDFIDRLQGLLEDYPADIAHFLELEVLENTAIGDTGEVAQIMARCSELGIRFSLDDFGTGYSSLTYFHRLPIDILKIDQNFVRHMLDNARDVDIVEGVLRLAEALDRPVIAEGVESETVGMILLQLGCRYAQGYGIARPMTADKVPAWLDQWQAENLWQQLPEQTGGASDLYDLNVSIFSHVQWLQGVIDAIRSNDPQQLAKVADNPCHLGRWYKGIGRVRYGNHPRFDLLPPQHRKLHELAQKLSHDSFQTNREIDPAEIKTLQRESEILVALLRDLAGSHTRH